MRPDPSRYRLGESPPDVRSNIQADYRSPAKRTAERRAAKSSGGPPEAGPGELYPWPPGSPRPAPAGAVQGALSPYEKIEWIRVNKARVSPAAGKEPPPGKSPTANRRGASFTEGFPPCWACLWIRRKPISPPLESPGNADDLADALLMRRAL